MKLADSKVNEILSQYDLGFVKNKRIVYDKWNVSYRIVSSKGVFLLKVLHYQNEKELKKELKIINKIGGDVPVVFPLLSKKGKPYINYKGKIIVIMSFVNGKPGLRGERLSEKNVVQLGKYYALIHSAKDLSRIPKKDLYLEMKRLFNKQDKSSEEYKLAKRTFDLLREKGFDSSKFPKGLIHADLHTENLLISKGKIVAVLDFEEAHVSSFIYDLGLGIFDTCYKDGGISEKRMKLFIRGYESKRKLTSLERKHLKNAVILAGLYVLYFLVRKNGVMVMPILIVI